jgi:hypothetical protein
VDLLFPRNSRAQAETGLLAGKNDPYVKFFTTIDGARESVRISPVVDHGGDKPKW